MGPVVTNSALTWSHQNIEGMCIGRWEDYTQMCLQLFEESGNLTSVKFEWSQWSEMERTVNIQWLRERSEPRWNTGAVKTFELEIERDTGGNKGTQWENKPYADVLQGSSLVSPARMKAILDFPSAIFNHWSVREG